MSEQCIRMECASVSVRRELDIEDAEGTLLVLLVFLFPGLSKSQSLVHWGRMLSYQITAIVWVVLEPSVLVHDIHPNAG